MEVWGATTCAGSVQLPYLNNWVLTLSAFPWLKGWVPIPIWLDHLKEHGSTPSLVVLNRGIHVTDLPGLLEAVDAALAYLRQALPEALIVFRNTPHGHTNCSLYDRPIYSRFSLNGAPFRWDEVPAQSEAVASFRFNTQFASL